MPHYLVIQREIDPAEREIYTETYGPITAVNPETAVHLSDADGEVIGAEAEYITEVYELAHGAKGEPVHYDEDSLEL